MLGERDVASLLGARRVDALGAVTRFNEWGQ